MHKIAERDREPPFSEPRREIFGVLCLYNEFYRLLAADLQGFSPIFRPARGDLQAAGKCRKATVLHEIAERDGAVFVGGLVEILNC